MADEIYVNGHGAANKDSEIRGQLMPSKPLANGKQEYLGGSLGKLSPKHGAIPLNTVPFLRNAS